MRWTLLAALTVAMTLSGNRTLGQTSSTAPTKIALVNLIRVFDEYHKCRHFAQDLRDTVKPLQDKANQHRKDMIEFGQDRKKVLNDIDQEIRTLLGKLQDDHLVMVWKDVATAAQNCAESKGFAVVLAYSDPRDLDERLKFPNINRKMQGMDLGGIIPLYVHPTVDITDDLIAALNRVGERKTRHRSDAGTK